MRARRFNGLWENEVVATASYRYSEGEYEIRELGRPEGAEAARGLDVSTTSGGIRTNRTGLPLLRRALDLGITLSNGRDVRGGQGAHTCNRVSRSAR